MMLVLASKTGGTWLELRLGLNKKGAFEEAGAMGAVSAALFGLLLAIGVFNIVRADAKQSESFREELLVHVNVPSRSVTTHFQFSLDFSFDSQTDKEATFSHFNLLPKALGKLIRKFDVEELHLTLTKGHWEYDNWGIPPVTSPHGAELAVSFGSGVTEDIMDAYWKGLTNGLSGLMCASLVFMENPHQPSRINGSHDPTFSRQNVLPFRPESQTSHPTSVFPPIPGLRTVRVGLLQGESVCTENLTPWEKLLPCRSQAGLGKLFSKPWHLYEGQYHSLGLHLEPIKLGHSYRLSLTLTLVSGAQGNEWNFARFFQYTGGVPSGCPVATSSILYVSPALDTLGYKVETALPLWESKQQRAEGLVGFDLLQPRTGASDLVITFKPQEKKDYKNNSPITANVVEANRWLIKWGHQSGKLAIHLENKLGVAVKAAYSQVIPWYMRIYYHTLVVALDRTPVDSPAAIKAILNQFQVEPATDRAWPGLLDAELELPPRSTVALIFEFETNFLHWSEFPPDAHRGFDIGSGILAVDISQPAVAQALAAERKEGFLVTLDGLNWSPLVQGQIYERSHDRKNIRVYTDGLLVALPTPDFSMPYNVIMMSCTLWALFFSSMLSMLTRRYKELYRGGSSFADDRPITRIIRLLARITEKFNRKPKASPAAGGAENAEAPAKAKSE